MPRVQEPTWPLRLSERDLEDLRGSGITDETIRACGRKAIYTEQDSLRLACLLGYNNVKDFCLSGALVFRYFGEDGSLNGYVRAKPYRPRIRKGKPCKYESPIGLSPHAYIPPATRRLLRAGVDVIDITEGEKKTLALSQIGRAAVGIGGVYSWKQADAEALIDDLAALDWRGKTVFIVFDHDPEPKTRRYVATAAKRLARLLRAAGAGEVFWVGLPPGPTGGKMGIDDFLVESDAAGREAFLRLVAEAQPVPVLNAHAPLTRAEGRTDASNAARFVARHEDAVRWVGPWGKWIVWDGTRWKQDQALAIDGKAKEVAAGLFAEITNVLWKNRPGQAAIDDVTRNAMLAHAKHSNGVRGIRNMVELAKCELAIGPEKLDADPWLLNVENGTLDLRTGLLREHRGEDFITKIAPVAFDPAADCPQWRGFLRTIFDGDDELIGYVQRLVGCSLTGVTEEHVLPFLHGRGANGKSTFCETVLKLLGPDYAMKAAHDLLMAKHGDSHPTDRADLWGKRFVACVETEEGRRIAETLTKELTGGDRIRARRMREDFWEYTPTHHVWLAGNHKPTIIGTDHGMWRRIKLIPFSVVISEADQDKKLPAKLVGELPGILSWAAAGCLDWQRGGLREPAIVRAATGAYSAEMDEVGQFIDEHCERGDFVAPATELHQRFQEVTGSRISQRAFGDRLRQKGFVNRDPDTGKECRTNKGKHGWRGLRLRSPAAAGGG